MIERRNAATKHSVSVMLEIIMWEVHNDSLHCCPLVVWEPDRLKEFMQRIARTVQYIRVETLCVRNVSSLDTKAEPNWAEFCVAYLLRVHTRCYVPAQLVTRREPHNQRQALRYAGRVECMLQHTIEALHIRDCVARNENIEELAACWFLFIVRRIQIDFSSKFKLFDRYWCRIIKIIFFVSFSIRFAVWRIFIQHRRRYRWNEIDFIVLHSPMRVLSFFLLFPCLELCRPVVSCMQRILFTFPWQLAHTIHLCSQHNASRGKT